MKENAILRTIFRRSHDRRPLAEQDQSPPDRRINGPETLALFVGVDIDQVQEILGDCEVLALPEGTTLLRPGEANTNVYLVLSGFLVTLINSDMPVDQGIVIPPGNSVGEMSVIDGKPVSALVLAKTNARLLCIPASTFWDQLSSIPGVARNLMAALSDRTRRGNEFLLESQRKQLALEHLKKELEVARQLQLSMLPLQRPIFPDRTDLEVEGSMEPAADVGGDLFDIFFIDKDRLFFCIGDVSGHGIPAALFMARTIGLLRVLAMAIHDPATLLQRANEQLSTNNDASIFVTLFCGFLDLNSGLLTYSNGGHCPPLIGNNEGVRLLPIPKGALIGAFGGLTYRTAEITLALGDTLFCYTDGVTEAPTADGGEYSLDRLTRLMASRTGHSLHDLLGSIKADLNTAAQSLPDDLTMLALRRK